MRKEKRIFPRISLSLALLLCAVALLSSCAVHTEPVTETHTAPSVQEESVQPAQEPGLLSEKAEKPQNTVLHAAYMKGAKGFFMPEKRITRAEIAQIFYNLQLTKPGKSTFSDVEPDSWYATAVSQLSGALKGYAGGTFHPDQKATLAEYLTILCRVLEVALPEMKVEDGARPPWHAPYFAAALENGWLEACPEAGADTPVSRAMAVSILNRALGRYPDKEVIEGLDETIFLDVQPGDDTYFDILEATISHSCVLEQDESWLVGSLKLPSLRPGIHRAGGIAYYVMEDRKVYRTPGILEADGVCYLVVDETGRIWADNSLHFYENTLVFCTNTGALLQSDSWCGFQFDSGGRYTSGNEEVDRYVSEILDACTDASMTQMEKLSACYCYVRDYRYLGRNSVIYDKTMSLDQAAGYANKMYSTGKGDCYNFAAAFYFLARALGYDARAVVGECGYIWNTHAIPHGWVEITMDGVDYLFDPEIENYNLRHGVSNETHGAFQVTYTGAPANYYKN